MPFYDRLNTASYTAPSGASFSFSYRAVRRGISHRIGSFEFPGIDGTLHQDKGVSGATYPMTVFIHGADYDLAADKFAKATTERGAGVLVHPRWGRLRVQVLKVSQDEDLTERSGQAVFKIEFQETLAAEFPETGASLKHEIPADADDFQKSAIDNYGDQVKADTIVDKNALETEMLLSTATVNTLLKDIASTEQSVAAKFRESIDSISTNINSYTDNPGGFASDITAAIRVVSEIPGRIDSKLQGYSSLLATLSARVMPSKNALLTDELIGTTALVASAESINATDFNTRAETVASAIYLRDRLVNLTNDLDAGQIALEDAVLGDSYAQVIDSFSQTVTVVSKAIKASIDLSFALPAERSVIIKSDTTIINLCYEFYGKVDDKTLDYFILTNALTGDEIITIPRGREVVYYV